MDVPAVVELGRTRLPVSSAQSLSPGDVIRLDTRVDDPARVYLGGKPKFLAHPFADDDRLSLQVAGRIPAQFADPYGTVPAAEADSLAERRPLSVVRGHDG
jgi:flagellar motor switch protein FliM